MKNIKAFTLVELIVVVTILAILATIGFVSYSGYLTGVRDTNRISSLTSISDGLELYRTTRDLPDPDDSIQVQINGSTIARQGFVGANVLQTIEYSKAGKDPKDDTYYSYYLTEDKKNYQLMAFMEETETLDSFYLSTKVNAVLDYQNRYPKVYGKKLGILTNEDKTPIQEIANLQTAGLLNILSGATDTYIANFSDADHIVGSGGLLASHIALDTNCKRLRDTGKTADGIYKISGANGDKIDVYCDMQNGGWALLIGTAPETTHLKYDSAEWTVPTINEDLRNPLTNDQITNAYANMTTNRVKICKKNFSQCFEMNHNLSRTLQSFFVDDISYINFSHHEYNHSLEPTNSHNVNIPPEIGEDRKEEFFESLGIDFTVSGQHYTKYGAGINIDYRNRVGFQADNNNGWPSQDNITFGFGGFSAYPNNCGSIVGSMPLSGSSAKSIAYHHTCGYYTPMLDQDRWFILAQ